MKTVFNLRLSWLLFLCVGILSASGSDRLSVGETLRKGESLNSSNGRYRLQMQTDGNCVLYDGATPLWKSDTNRKDSELKFEAGPVATSGLRVVARNGAVQWFAPIANPATLVLQDDGNLVVYDDQGLPGWNTGTWSLLRDVDWEGLPDRQAFEFFSGAVNAVRYAQVPNYPEYFIGRNLPESGVRLVLVKLISIDGDYRFEFVKDLLSPGDLIADNLELVSAYDPTTMAYDSEIWVAFECTLKDSGHPVVLTSDNQNSPVNTDIQNHTSSGVGVLNTSDPDPENWFIDRSRISIPILGGRDGKYLYSASVPKLIVYNGLPYLYYTVVKQRDDRSFVDIHSRGVVLYKENVGRERMWALNSVTGVHPIDPELTTVVFDNAGFGQVADVFDVKVTADNRLIVSTGLGDDNCLTPADGPENCYYHVFSETGDPLSYNCFVEARLPDGSLRFAITNDKVRNSPNEYPTFFRLPDENGVERTALMTFYTSHSGVPFERDNSGVTVFPNVGDGILLRDDEATFSDLVPDTESTSDSIGRGKSLAAGESIDSANGLYSLVMQQDGNLVLYKRKPDGMIISSYWATDTSVGESSFRFQSDGNLVIVAPDGSAQWDTGTYRLGGIRFQLQDDGNLVLLNTHGFPIWSTNTPDPELEDGILVIGDSMSPGQFLSSPKGRYVLRLQQDGNLVLYGPGDVVLWRTDTHGDRTNHDLVFQEDGNLVMYKHHTAPLWSTGTAGAGGVLLSVRDNGNLVMVDASLQIVWQSGLSQMINGNRLSAGEQLILDETDFRMVMQSDGNLVVYRKENPLWASGTTAAGAYFEFGHDSNLAIYGGDGGTLWTSGTVAFGGTKLSFADDGNVLMTNLSGVSVWDLGTGDRLHSSHCLKLGEVLGSGESLTSPNLRYRLAMQSDGNLVLYDCLVPLWASGTSDPGAVLEFEDSTLRVVANGIVQWEAQTTGSNGKRLIVEDDGNVVMYRNNGNMVWQTYTANADHTSHVLRLGQTLESGKSITSPDRRFSVVVQADGNLVLYRDQEVIWATGTFVAGSKLVFQGDSNLVLADPTGAPLWASHTQGSFGREFRVLDNGNVALIDLAGDHVWEREPVDRLHRFHVLYPGDSLLRGEFIASPSGRYSLVMGGDGILRVYDGLDVLWSAGPDTAGDRFDYQTDGNLVVYRSDGSVAWASNTRGLTSFVLMQGDGNFVLYHDDGSPYWSTGTGDPNRALPLSSLSGLAGPGELTPGQSIFTDNRRIVLTMGLDGALVLYRDRVEIWRAQAQGSPGSTLQLSADGELRIDDAGTTVWSTNGGGAGACILTANNDGNVVLFNRAGDVVWQTGSGDPRHETHRLALGEYLNRDESITSPNLRYRLVMQTDGNAVLYEGGTPLWATGVDPAACHFALGLNSELGLISTSGASWRAGTEGWGAAYVTVADTGIVELRTAVDEVIWRTGFDATHQAPSELGLGAYLLANERLVSPNGQRVLSLSGDGVLRLETNGEVHWQVGDPSLGRARLIFEEEGNLALQPESGSPSWSTNTGGSGASRVSLLDQGILTMIASDGWMVWRSGFDASHTAPSMLFLEEFLLSNEVLISPNGEHVFGLTDDGIAQLKTNGEVVWEAGVSVSGQSRLLFQGDGNLVLGSRSGGVNWSADTVGLGAAFLSVQDGGNVVLSNVDYDPVWHIGTGDSVVVRDSLMLGESLSSGNCLISQNLDSRLCLRSDGVVELRSLSDVLWELGDPGNEVATLVFGQDASLRLIDPDGAIKWTAGTEGMGGVRVTLQDNSNFVMRDTNGAIVWQSGLRRLLEGFAMGPGETLSPLGSGNSSPFRATMLPSGDLVLSEDGFAYWRWSQRAPAASGWIGGLGGTPQPGSSFRVGSNAGLAMVREGTVHWEYSPFVWWGDPSADPTYRIILKESGELVLTETDDPHASFNSFVTAPNTFKPSASFGPGESFHKGEILSVHGFRSDAIGFEENGLMGFYEEFDRPILWVSHNEPWDGYANLADAWWTINAEEDALEKYIEVFLPNGDTEVTRVAQIRNPSGSPLYRATVGYQRMGGNYSIWFSLFNENLDEVWRGF